MMSIAHDQADAPESFKRGTLTRVMNGLLICFLCIAALFTQPAVAARAYFDGTAQSNRTICAFSNADVEVLRSYAGYFTDPNEPYPKTGDIAYVRAGGINMSPCVDDFVRFEFSLPDGASFAISATNPVVCMRGHTSDSYWEYVPNDSTSSCSQTPFSGAGGYYFGQSGVPGIGNWWYEVRVPVVFNKQLLGLAGPSTHRLSVTTLSGFGALSPFQPVTVFYQTAFQNLASSSITSSSASLAFNLLNYYKGGSLYIDYGTTNPPASSIASTPIPANALSYPITSSLTGLVASTTYFWRVRFVTSDGTTFTSTPVQSFTTSGGLGPQTLTVSNAGTGAGTVTSSPAGISCGASCSASFTANSNVTLSASPATGSTFSGWNGAGCTGTGSCVVAMSAAQSVTATFTSSGTPTLITVVRAGAGTGTVISDPVGIDCGKTCSASFTARGNVVLTATAKAGSTFSGWTGGRGLNRGDCSVDVTCTLPPNTAQTVTATFVLAGPQTLTVSKTGTGAGTVTSSPVGIDCGATCSANFTASSGVTLSASPAAGSMFTGWNGAGCSGIGTCTVTMSAAQSVSATLMREIGSLSITLDGLPASSTALLGITGPDGLSTTRNSMTGTGFNLSDVATGTYTVIPPTVKINGRTYTAPPQSVVVNSGSTPATINIVYSLKATDLTPILMLLLD